jgi:menaquinone-dependent protoporphyrinogen IX oxidase
MNSIILYRSKTGAARQYAEWLSEELIDSKVEQLDHVSIDKVLGYEIVVYVLPTYGGLIDGKDFLVSGWPKLEGKKVYLVAVGMVPQDESWSIKSYNILPENVRNGLAGYVKLPGITPGSAKKNVSWFEKLAMKIFLKTDLDKIRKQKNVKREDLQRAVEMIKRTV